MNFDQLDFTALANSLSELAVTYGLRAILAIFILVLGFKLIGWLSGSITKGLERSKVDKTLSRFLINLTSIGLKILVIIAALSQIGVQTASFVAILGASSLAVGLALQGALSNFAGGALILFLKPYEVGDFVETQGHTGFVTSIQIFNTVIETLDSKTIFIPNGQISAGSIVNYTKKGQIRVDLEIGIAYEADIRKARDVIMDAIKSNPEVLEQPAPSVNVLNLADSAVVLAVRPYAEPDKYWQVYFKTLEDAKIALDKAGIKIPYPQQEVYMKQI